MHKRLVTCFVVSLMIVTLCGAGHATLIVDTDVVYDDVSGLTWMKGLSKFTDRTYDEQITDIGMDTTAGITDWHMATYDEIVTLWTYDMKYEIMSAFIPSLHEEFPIPEIPGASMYWKYWTGRIDDESTPGSHYGRSIVDSNCKPLPTCWVYPIMTPPEGPWGETLDIDSEEVLGAWVVSGSGAPVPEPSTMLLLGTGLVGLVGLRRKFRT